MKKTYLIIAGALAVIISLYGYTESRAAGDTITICVRRSGLVYVIGEGFRRSDCRGTDQLVSWNSEGVPGPQGPAGVDGTDGTNGADGAPGPQGPAGTGGGPLNLYKTSSTLNIPISSLATLTAECRPGDQVISGGFILGNTFLQVVESQPSIAAVQGWRVGVNNPNAFFADPATAFAWCSDITP